MDQLITRIEYLHSRDFLHRDLKPDNFCIGLGENAHKIYLIDLGLAKRYFMRNGKHIAYRDCKRMVGNSRYASIYAHDGL
jgi:serine/threonine protein kinase